MRVAGEEAAARFLRAQGLLIVKAQLAACRKGELAECFPQNESQPGGAGGSPGSPGTGTPGAGEVATGPSELRKSAPRLGAGRTDAPPSVEQRHPRRHLGAT